MPKQIYLWLLERKIGNWASWSAKGSRGTLPNEKGVMGFGKGDYAIDPTKFRIWKVPKWIKPNALVKVQLWKEDEITPVDFFAQEKRVGDDFTATLLQRISKIKRLDLSRVNRETDKVVMILAIALMVAVGAIGVLAYLVVNK
jgi:hypothetical protein